MQGCAPGKKCPCRTWAQCTYYNNLKYPSWNTDHLTHEWYDIYFRDTLEMGFMGNG